MIIRGKRYSVTAFVIGLLLATLDQVARHKPWQWPFMLIGIIAVSRWCTFVPDDPEPPIPDLPKPPREHRQ